MAKRLIPILGLALCTAGFIGCASVRSIIKPGAHVSVNTMVIPAYSGPQAAINVADFDIQAAKATGEIGSGLKEMFVTALFSTNRFVLGERLVLTAPTQKQEVASSGTTPIENPAQNTKSKTADLIITAALTEFEPEASGGSAGVGGGGGVGSGMLGALIAGALNKAHMALDIRVVDASTSEVLSSGRVQGQASDIAGLVMGGYIGKGVLGAGLSGYADTPMEKAIRICIIEAVRYISQTTPVGYFKY